MSLSSSSILITGASRGLGRGIAEAATARGAKVTLLARPSNALTTTAAALNAQAIAADITDADAAHRILADTNPDILVLNAGLPPPMAPIDTITWQDFTATWDTDVKAGLHWVQAALTQPLKPGSRVLLTSFGAAIMGSPMSGGFGGAKRMLWFIAHYANTLSSQRQLGIRFQTLIPRQMVAGTGTGDAGSHAYAAAQSISPEAFLERFGAPLDPRVYGDMVMEILSNPIYAKASAFGLKADTGITPIEGPGL
ncbi:MULTISPECIES: SDR family oxidoreductase [Asticcacaulis]|uniref:SDR family oxidoreductase n=1 Tax=Asticcacaulis TaxID=76890 RepID=UPI001AE88E53|nr:MULTISPECIES: SDR family oxidoreductase [Asticcacaulis]MBP2160456.1 NAD(P)-dependent dehydrogenase (short-subunit alcohol dehydrogenase family) [Asticcacaulis solisilvae]MDR6801501.1 NAD(P)-dependent dehydrogenase (short-subunit alcohol dehydrogenase family) [Asticcacaulis sp. BE141]